MVRERLRAVAQIIVDEVIPEMKSSFVSDPSRLDGHLEDSVRASASAGKRGASASVKLGSEGDGNTDAKVPYGGWAEFGGPGHKSNRPPNRTFKKEGRWLFPAVKRERYRLIRSVEQAMHDLAAMIEGRP